MLRKRPWTALLIAAALLAAVGADAEMPGPDAESLYRYITATEPYQQWRMWPDHTGLRQGRPPHGAWHRVYVNPTALQAKSLPFPPGSIEVKENYDYSVRFTGLTVMYKIQGFNPRNSDWFWVEYTPEGKSKAAGKVKRCIGCHSAGADTDYNLVHNFR